MNSPQPSKEAAAIESITHVAKKICLMWGSDELDGYFDQLVLDSRDGQRKGFPVEVSEELVFLAEINTKVRAIDLAQRIGIPLGDALRKVEEGDRDRKNTGAIYDPMISRELAHREEKATNLGTRQKNFTPRSGRDRRRAAAASNSNSFVALIFRLATSRVTLILIILVLAVRLLRPALFST
jgi:hypothetical protein